MRASIVTAVGSPFELREVELAAPIGREVVVEVHASGLCHSDLLMAGHDLGLPMPLLLGHEIAGVVRETGPAVRDIRVGDHVVGCLIPWCGECVSCLRGEVLDCERPRAVQRSREESPRITLDGAPLTQGFGLGGFAERVLTHENQVTAVPHELPFPHAAVLGCSVATGVGSVRNAARVREGQIVVVIGTGGVGLNAISGARLAGAERIIAVDVSADKLELARAFGATDVVDSSAVDPVDAVREIARRGAHAVFDFVGVGPVTAQALRMVRQGGGLYLIGILDPSAELALRTYDVVNARIRVQGVAMGESVPRRDIPALAELAIAGRLELDALVSHEVALAELDAAWGLLREPGAARVVVTSF